MIKIKQCEFGRGLFATQDIEKGTVVEVSPYIDLCKKDMKKLKDTILWFYVYALTDKPQKPEKCALALGLGSLFNHSEDDNIKYKINTKKGVIKYTAKRDIPKGTQLFIDYGYSPADYDKAG